MNIMQKPFMKLPKTESFTLNGAGGFFESARASSNHKLLVSCIARHSTQCLTYLPSLFTYCANRVKISQ